MHNHSFESQGNYLICPECGKKKLNLIKTDEENILQGVMSDGRTLTVRNDRHRYFFPGEWNTFIKTFKNDKHKLLFLTLIHTGSRIMEALHLKPKNFDFERGTITFEVVKQRKAKRQFYAIGKSRTFFVSQTYLKEVKSYIQKNKIEDNKYLFLDNDKIPADYDSLSNIQKKKYYENYKSLYFALFKRKLQKAGIKDWKNFSLHNIRKTYGNWMRIYDIKIEELCYRLGHDVQTYLTHYGSSLIFTSQERMAIMKIMGEVK